MPWTVRAIGLTLAASLVVGVSLSARQFDPLKGIREKAEQLQKKIDCKVAGAGCPDTKQPDGKPSPSENGPAPTLDAAVSVVPLAPMSPNPLMTTVVSNDFAHAAGAAMKGSRTVLVVDGQEGPAFDAIVASAPGERVVGGAAVFSPDGKRVAYIGRRSGQQIAVIDGKEGPAFRSIGFSFSSTKPLFLFSSDSRRVAYVAEVVDSVQRMVLDGVSGPEYFQIVEMLFAGQRLVYVARTKENKYIAVVDQQPLPGAPFDSIDFLTSSEDGHFAFVAMRGNSWTVVVDGVEGKIHQRPTEAFDGRSLVLSPRGGRVAYLAITRPDNNSGIQPVNLYVDGKVLRTANGFNFLTFSPDGNRLGGAVFQANSDGTQRTYAFVDEWNSLDYRSVAESFPGPPSSSGVFFSPDSKRFALIAANGMSTFAVVDGKESNGYAEIKNFQFSNDGRRYAFEARHSSTSGGGSVVVVDGKEGPKLYSMTRNSLTFSPDGSRVAYVGNATVMEGVAVVDGAVQKVPTGAFTQRVPKSGAAPPRYFAFSPDGKRVARIEQLLDGSGRNVVVLDDKPQTPGTLFTMPVFTADGRHFAYATWFNQKWLLSLDGKSMPIDGDLYEAPGSLVFQEDGSLRFLTVKDNLLSKVVVAAR